MLSPIQINQSVSIPGSEIHFTFSCSSGPGGQHVNKVNTRVTLWFDLAKSGALSPGQKEIIQKKLSSRINKNGVLRVVSYKHRSQNANRIAAVENFSTLFRTALVRRKSRTQTKVSNSQKLKRLANKKNRSRLKSSRGKADEEY
jgi:ribosome-associated protein